MQFIISAFRHVSYKANVPLFSPTLNFPSLLSRTVLTPLVSGSTKREGNFRETRKDYDFLKPTTYSYIQVAVLLLVQRQSDIRTDIQICILIYSYIQQDAALHSLFYLETALHVSVGTATHNQESKQLYLQHLLFVTPLLLSTAVVEDLELV